MCGCNKNQGLRKSKPLAQALNHRVDKSNIKKRVRKIKIL